MTPFPLEEVTLTHVQLEEVEEWFLAHYGQVFQECGQTLVRDFHVDSHR